MPHVNGGRPVARLAISFGLIAGFMVVEVAAGFLTGSLSLLSDAGHMATDALGLGMALAAMVAARRVRPGGGHTYGAYRLEILAALANALLLAAVSIWVILESWDRFQSPPEIRTGPMLVVAVVGLGVNVFTWRLLHRHATESLNVRGAYMEVVADSVASVGVIAAALITMFSGWPYADPLVAALVGLFILPRAWSLGREAVRVLVQAAPQGLDLAELESRLGTIQGVVDVHDLHVWTLTSQMEVASVHVIVDEETDTHVVLDEARVLLQDRYGIDHATLQVEPESHRECSEVSW